MSTQLAIPDLHVSSAGIRAAVGQPMHPVSASILERFGGDASNFAAKQLTPRMALEADLILTMTRAQRDAVLELAPRRLNRTFTLGEVAQLITAHGVKTIDSLAEERPRLYANEAQEVEDPIGRSYEFHSRVGAQIAELLIPVLHFCELA